MSASLDQEAALSIVRDIQEKFTQLGKEVTQIPKEDFVDQLVKCIQATSSQCRCFSVCDPAKQACICAEAQEQEPEAEEAEADAEDDDPDAATEAVPEEAKMPGDDIKEEAGFRPEMVPSPYPTTYPLQYMICGDCLYPKDPTCSCGGKYKGTKWVTIPPKKCPGCDGKKVCPKCDGAGTKASKKPCPGCPKKKGACPQCQGNKTINCNVKGCNKGVLTRPKACELCAGKGEMMVWDGNMAFFFNQHPGISEWIKFRGLTIEPKKWGPIAGKVSSGHGCFAGLKSSFKGEYMEDPDGKYPLGIMEIVVDTGKNCGNGTRHVKFLGKLRKNGKGNFKWEKEGSLYGDANEEGYFKGGWIELFQTWAKCEVCGDSATPGYIGQETIDCEACDNGKRKCPMCKKVPGKCLKCKGKGEIPETQDCPACTDGYCTACGGEGKTPEERIKVPQACPICNDSGVTGAKHTLVPKFERLFYNRPWQYYQKDEWNLRFGEAINSFLAHTLNPLPAAWVDVIRKEKKALRLECIREEIESFIDMGPRSKPIPITEVKYAVQWDGKKIEGRFLYNPMRLKLLLYFGESEDNLGEPMVWFGDCLDVYGLDDWTDFTGQGRSFEHGFALKADHVGGYGIEKRITFIDITPEKMKEECAVRAMCQLRMTFDGCVMLGAGKYKLADLPFHHSKIKSVWTGVSDRGSGEDICLCFEAFKSEDCTGEKISLKTCRPGNSAGTHEEWDHEIKSFRIFPKEGCEAETGWGDHVPRWPKPPPVCDLPNEWDMGARVWALFHACTSKQLSFIDDEGNEDFRFETWTQRWRRIWKTEAKQLWGMTADYRMIPYVEPEPEVKEPLDFNGEWLVTYKAYFGVKDNISVKNNEYTHKGKTLKIVDSKIKFPNGSTSHLREAESEPDRIEWLNSRLSLVIWTRKS
mmetsp:Transcript_983/g.2745  ORF Transcript_983/g.2745 Transcript_983/m.2745 type:complete len:919 (-) Transcript_983:157-2913(-)